MLPGDSCKLRTSISQMRIPGDKLPSIYFRDFLCIPCEIECATGIERQSSIRVPRVNVYRSRQKWTSRWISRAVFWITLDSHYKQNRFFVLLLSLKGRANLAAVLALFYVPPLTCKYAQHTKTPIDSHEPRLNQDKVNNILKPSSLIRENGCPGLGGNGQPDQNPRLPDRRKTLRPSAVIGSL